MKSTAEIAEEVFWSLLKNNVHTIKPAVITSVDYDNACLDATPTSQTLFSDGTLTTEPTVYDIPILVISANNGVAKITMPIKVGDRCFLIYSDRDYGELLDTDGKSTVEPKHVHPFGRHPIGALCCFFTQASPTTIDSTNVVIQNNAKTNITLAPAGNISITTPKDVVVTCANATVNASEDITATCASLTATASDGATINADTTINGDTAIVGNLTVSETAAVTGTLAVGGAITGASGGTATVPSIEVADSLTAGGVEVIGHVHGGVQSGSATTTAME